MIYFCIMLSILLAILFVKLDFTGHQVLINQSCYESLPIYYIKILFNNIYLNILINPGIYILYNVINILKYYNCEPLFHRTLSVDATIIMYK